MFHAAQSLKNKSLVAVGASISLLASARGAVVYAEGKERRQKLPIYDEPEPEMVIKEEPTRLNEALRAARQETDRQILGMKYHLQQVTDKVVEIEKEAETNIKSVLVKEEEVMPAAIYVVVAGFAGSIAASRRGIFLRLLTPVTFSALAFGYFFPASSNRLIARASHSDYSKYLPEDIQKQVREFTGNNTTSNKISTAATNTAKDAGNTVQEKVQDVVEDIKEKVAEIKKAIVEEVDEEKAKAEKVSKEAELELRAAKVRAENALKRV
ncbi:apolipo protein O-domain-containing protein [Mortierella sp. GBAus27b]|nr:hypothetical protein BGX31_009323 [Mortierella sp. GBA43]KAI8350190.1 apolipo protein O-domain-containing protein [Mortierella sp. GBAus27b]